MLVCVCLVGAKCAECQSEASPRDRLSREVLSASFIPSWWHELILMAAAV